MEIDIRYAGDPVEPVLQGQIREALRVALGDEFEDGERVELRHRHGAFSVQAYAIPDPDDPPVSVFHTDDGEVHPGEVVEEKISLSERFGLWLSFYPFTQAEYLAIVGQWLREFGVDEARIAAARQDSLVWALERGSRSGRVAYQFARDYSGRQPP